ncbi:hypothetical protein ACFX2J_018659 [Malus domestica]
MNKYSWQTIQGKEIPFRLDIQNSSDLNHIDHISEAKLADATIPKYRNKGTADEKTTIVGESFFYGEQHIKWISINAIQLQSIISDLFKKFGSPTLDASLQRITNNNSSNKVYKALSMSTVKPPACK